MRQRKTEIRRLVTAALAAALLAILAPWVIPIGAVGITLATLVLFTVSLTLPPAVAIMACAVYLLLGAIGLPVFAGFVGGFAAFLSPTGGFLIGYLPLTVTVSLAGRLSEKRAVHLAASVFALILLYTIGGVFYMAVTDATALQAVTVSVIPFILPDLVKLAAAIAIADVIRKRIPRL